MDRDHTTIENRLLRSAVTVFLFARILASYVWFGLVTMRYVRAPKTRARRFEALHEKNAGRVYRAFVLLKGVYIKVGQFLSTQVVLPPAYLIEMAKMQDRVPVAHTDEIHKRIAEELGQTVHEAFREFSDDPLACASIGQVHRCTMPDGRDAVVKVKYPGIDRSFQDDLKLLKALVPIFIQIIERIYYREATGIDQRAIVNEFVKYIGLELDYRNEVKNHRKMVQIMRERDDVIVPELYEEYCTDALICMEFIDARRMHEFFVDPAVSDERKNLAYQKLVDCLLFQVSRYGFFQADTHPGNFLVRDNGDDLRIVMLDFGCAKQLPEDFRQNIIRAVQGYINRDAEMSAQAYWDMGFRTKKYTLESLQLWAEWVFTIVDQVVEHFSEGEPIADYLKRNAMEMGAEYYQLTQSDRIDYIPDEYIMFGRALATPPVPFDRFQPKADLVALIMPHLANLSMPPPPLEAEGEVPAENAPATG